MKFLNFFLCISTLAKNSAEPPKSYVISAGLEPDSFCGLFPTWTYYDNVAKLHIQVCGDFFVVKKKNFKI